MNSQPVHDIRCLYDQKVPMRDGILLSADVYLPVAAGLFPTLLLRTPYESTRDGHIDWAAWWARRGYACVVGDNRGKFESQGQFYPYRDDGPDGHDTLEWIAAQAWCSGKIGTSGRSYGGLFQWQLAPHRSQHLTAMAPQVIMGDYYGDYHHTGGAVQWAITLMAAITFATNVAFAQRGCAHLFGNQKFYRTLPLIDADVLAIGREIPFFRDWLRHSEDDAYWQAINTENKLDQIAVPVVQQCGWYDAYTAASFRMWNGLRERAYSEHARKNQKIYVVPWTHHIPEGSRLGDIDFGPNAFIDLNAEDLRWFDHWLKEVDNGIMDEPPIRLFVMGANVWRGEYEWPLARTVFTPYYLHSDGRANSLHGDGLLSPTLPGEQSADHFDYDPDRPVPTLGGNNTTWTQMKFAVDQVLPGPIDQRPVERRDDVLVYTSAVLDHDLEVTGPLEVVLYVRSSAPDTDFTAQLVDVHPGGQAIHLAEGILRMRYRHGFDKARMLAPGELACCRIELAPTSNVFLAGHRLRLEISSSNFPRFNRNLNTDEDIATGTRWEIAHQTVLHDSLHPSHIVLPVIPATPR